MTTTEAARRYLKRGFMPLPIRNGKDPGFPGWQKFEVREEDLEKHFAFVPNVGLLLGKPSGNLVDVDLDCMEARNLAHFLLPQTAMIGGRKKSPRSHFFYRCEGARTGQWIDPDIGENDKRLTIVELRATGAQTLVHPSKHPSGDDYEWSYDDKLEPATIPYEELRRVVGRLAACALITRRWKEGQRHPLALALAGALYRAGWQQNQVEHIFYAIAQVAEDPEWPDRRRAIETTFEKLEVDQRATGIPTLVSIVGEKVVSKVQEWLELKNERVVAAEQSHPIEGDHAHLDFITHHTDEGNAQRLVSQHGENLRWVHEPNCWFAFHEGQWKPDNALARRWALDVPRRLYLQAGASDLEKDVREEIFKFAMRTENERSQRAMLELAKKHLTVHIGEFDRDPWLFNCSNGTLNLKTGEFRDHRREDMLTCISPTVWTGQENCLRFTEYLEQVFLNDYEIISFVRRAAGLSLLGQVFERILFFCWGAGHNGKSTLLETLAFVMGPDYAGAAAPDLLMDADYTQQGHELASLRSLRFVSAIETSEGRRLAESRVKQITGRDRVKACMKYGHPFEFTPKFTVWLATNHKPIIRGTDDAIWHRLSGLIPFQAKFIGENDDRELPAKLQAEASGILAWAVRGLTEYLETGLGSASKIDQELAKYRSESDLLAEFISDRCVVGDDLSVSRGDIWQEYKKWCADTGTDGINSTTFGRRLNEKGFIRDASGKKRLGIGLKSYGE